ncbi:MAG: PorT family protein, partial [Lachnospiraceae bacterium]|nr:PorT family protein [Lachnospiraceae bacterium]
MKPLHKLAITLLALASALRCAAQPGDSEELPFYDSSHASKFLEIDLHAGIGISSVAQNYGSVVAGITDFFYSPGVLMRAGAQVRFNIRNSFGIGTGIDFGINNSRYAMNMVSNGGTSISSIYVTNHFYDASIPLFISFRFNAGRSMCWSIDPGWYFSVGLGGHSTLSGYTSGENALGQPLVTHASYEHRYFNSDRPFINTVKSFDNGPRLALSMLFKRRVS